MPEETRTLPIRLPLSEYDKVKQLAEDEGRTMSDVVRLALQNYLSAAGVETKIRVKRGGNMRKNSE